MRRILTVVVAGCALLGLAAAPALAQYPPAAPSLAVSATVVTPGDPLTVSGSGWLPASEVTLTFLSSPVVLGTATTDANGAFTTQVTIPADASPGRHTIRATGLGPAGQPRTVDVAITVAGAADRDGVVVIPDRGLPRTGSGALASLVAAGGLLVVGTLAVVTARRRNRTEVGV